MSLKNKIVSFSLALALLSQFGVMSKAMTYDEIRQIKGADRYATAGSISGDMGSYDSVILVNADKNLADGLSASGLSGVIKAPILLVKKDSIPNETQLRLDIAKKIYIIGSENSISKSVENQLKDENMGGFSVKRIGGSDRIETSNNIAKEIINIKGSIGKVFVTNGNKGEADAMSISAVASRDGEPVLLTNGSTINDVTASIIEKTRNVYAIGGRNLMSTGLVSSISATRISGDDRYKTNAAVIKNFYKDYPTKIYLSDGYKLVDALTGGPLAGRNVSPIALVGLNSDKTALSGANELVSLGGISESILRKCAAAVNG
ncbi:cell wall-binding repeat-containing protein [Peptostreptococcus faecalis]|uniref:cell wall-binding repeat-containing protein n=1 Tax=Peptostreptococcus faecalis TaxID=2045015 RepID=UPI000C7A62B4|nr:cell wall-binding repeat-containing protein [Peptostreptococcus faecalis]